MQAKKRLVYTNFDSTDGEQAFQSDQDGTWVARKTVCVDVKELVKNFMRIAEDGDTLIITVEVEEHA